MESVEVNDEKFVKNTVYIADNTVAADSALTDLEVVCKLMQAYQLLGEVFQNESPMIINLAPECLELFLEQASQNFIEMHKRMASQDD